ncbi:hypothetical protein LWI28_024145 [Acer negundo]|uniref:Remorin C-terminal domain-containing protein n=1 Tax=Acer negundo TaxID=4023 RepID=A0AAD5ISG0_ACENE|nr:hypothetical protein LWI28_024145 [Acer negundo]
MENLAKQKRVRFFNPRQEESSSAWERLPLQQAAESLAFLGNKVHNWFQSQLSWQMNQDYNARDAEFAAAVAAAAFAVYSIEAEYQRKKREDLEMSRTKLKSRKQDTKTGLQQSSGETSTRNLVEMDHSRGQESGFPMRRPSRSSSVRSTSNHVAIDRKHKGIEPGDKNVETKADAWGRAQMEKNVKRYEKIKSRILDWENERKMQAKLKMERKKSELEKRRTANQKHYQNKIARIEHIAGGARAQAEEERRKKESEIKQIKLRGKDPVRYCFCC